MFEGLRACAVNGGAEYLAHESPDVLCLQVLALTLITERLIHRAIAARNIIKGIVESTMTEILYHTICAVFVEEGISRDPLQVYVANEQSL